MRQNLFLLFCVVSAALGQQGEIDDSKCTNQKPENDLNTSPRQSEKLQNLVSSLITFNPTLNAPGKCGEHSRLARDAARNLEVWALEMYDSHGRVPSSLLSGNVNQYGDFDQCLRVEHQPQGSADTINGQYVLAHFDLQVNGKVNHPQLQHLLTLAHSYDVITSNFSDPGHRIPRFSTINWGFCVPSSCSAKDVENGLREALQPLSSIPEFKLALQVDEAMMYTKQAFNPDLTTCLVILLFAALFSSVLLATLMDRPDTAISPLSKCKRIFLAFSLKRTCKELLNTSSSPDDISALHGLRFANALLLIMCHKAMAIFYYPYINRTELVQRFEHPWTVLGRTAILYTDTFIILSGLLVAYTLTKDLEKNGSISLKTKLKARFLRITPNFAAIILFCTYILQLMGTGPQWNLVIKHYSSLCKDHMWKNFLYIHNYFGFENMCLTHTHQLGIDMQLFIISPIMVYLVWKWPRLGSSVLVTVAAASTWLRYTVTYKNELSSIVYFGNPVKKMFDTCNMSYILPTHRLTVYIMGIFTGIYLRKNPNGINFNWITTVLGWVFSFLICIYPWFSPYIMSKRNFVYNVEDAAFYAAYAPILWGMFIISLIFLCHKNRGGLIGTLSRWPGFQIFTKISYAVYLTQFPVFFYNVGTTRNSGHAKVMDLLEITQLLAVLIASVLLTLMVDLPFQDIKKIVTERDGLDSKAKVEEKSFHEIAASQERAAKVRFERDVQNKDGSIMVRRNVNTDGTS